MAGYRIYCSDGQGRVDLAKWFAAGDDGAIAKLREVRRDCQKAEVWQKGRLVAKLGANGQLQKFGT